MTMLENKIDKEFVSKDGHDLCIICKVPTKYKTETRIDQRENYVEGCGQLCIEDYNKIFGEIKNDGH